ncbi:MAG: hypothetical protein ACI4KF_00670 [Huintestinicola sp.]
MENDNMNVIAELEQRTKDAHKQTKDAINAAKVWFYNMTGISLITPNDITKNGKEDSDGNR